MRKNNFAETNYHFADVNYHFTAENREKPILRRHFLDEAKTIELQGLEANIRMEEKYKKH